MSNSTQSADGPLRWLSEDERRTWLALTAMLTTLPAAIDAQLKRDVGLNFFEYSILAYLSDSPGRSLQMTTLAHLAAGSLSRLSHAVTRLERQGWVQRHVQTGETRCTEAVLTDAGMTALAAAAPEHVDEARRLVFDILSPTQQRQLRRICQQLVRTSAPNTSALLDDMIDNSGA